MVGPDFRPKGPVIPIAEPIGLGQGTHNTHQAQRVGHSVLGDSEKNFNIDFGICQLLSEMAGPLDLLRLERADTQPDGLAIGTHGPLGRKTAWMA